jgi:hypothetical protein
MAVFLNAYFAFLQQYLVFSFVLSLVCATMAWENRGHRMCTLDSTNKQYSFYENGHLTYAGAFNNVYIRLKEQKYGKNLLDLWRV